MIPENPPTPDTSHCLVCQHGAIELSIGVICKHPQRPPENRQVIKWFNHQCPQFKRQENQ